MTQPIFFSPEQLQALEKLLRKAQPHSDKEMILYFEMYKKVCAAKGVADARKELLSHSATKP